jgi:hypothetical protein
MYGNNLNETNYIQEETKSRMTTGNVDHSEENILSSGLLSKNMKIKTYKIIILRVLLYGCETWSLKLKDKRRLRVFENRALRRIFGPKRDEVTREWRKLHNEELNDLYPSPSIFRVIKLRIMSWEGHIVLWRRVRWSSG